MATYEIIRLKVVPVDSLFLIEFTDEKYIGLFSKATKFNLGTMTRAFQRLKNKKKKDEENPEAVETHKRRKHIVVIPSLYVQAPGDSPATICPDCQSTKYIVRGEDGKFRLTLTLEELESLGDALSRYYKNRDYVNNYNIKNNVYKKSVGSSLPRVELVL